MNIEEVKQLPILILDEECRGGLLKYLGFKLPRLRMKLQKELSEVFAEMGTTLDLIIETKIGKRMKLIRKLERLAEKRLKIIRLLSIYWGE